MRARWLRVAGFFAAWLVVAVPVWLVLFTGSSAQTVMASHDATVHPTLDGKVRLDLGPYLPDVRFASGGPVGVYVELGKTSATSGAELAERYASIAAHPAAEEERIGRLVVGLAGDAAVRAAIIGLLPLGLWALVGKRRRAELLRLDKRLLGAAGLAVALALVLLAEPWEPGDDLYESDTWLPIQQALPDLSVPKELQGWQLQSGLVTTGTRRLMQSAFDTYATSTVFYRDAVDRVDTVKPRLHVRGEGESVAVLVSDRHDNIGMDDVARAIGDAADASVVLDAGDDTSTGEEWESFSLESLNSAFEGYVRVAVSGNHDHGTFVNRYLERRGWTHLDGEAVTPFADVRITGVDDPRSSGLGNWRDEKGLTFSEVKEQIADDVCADDEDGQRIATLLVHDANLGATALERGCTDLVLAGHLHVQKGPTRVVGENGKAGWTYTNGTTGGAAYAIALGSKLRRDAQVTLVTYADGRPVGLQPVTVRTTGDIIVAPYTELELE